MRILYSHYLAPEDHPAVRMVQAIAAELSALGHSVRIHRSAGPPVENLLPKAASAESSTEKHASVQTRIRAKAWFAKALWRNRAMRRRDLAVLREFDPDVVLCRQDAYCYSMQYWCKRLGFPLVVYADAPVAYESRVYGDPSRWHPGRLPETIERMGLEAAESVITVSRPAKRLLQRVAPHVPIHVIPNGVYPERFEPIHAAERNQLRDELGLHAPLVVGFLGTFRAFHGIDLLRDLMQRTTDRSDIQWLLIGDGPRRAALEKASHGWTSTVFTGKQPPERVGKLLQLMNIGVAPYQPARGEVYFCPLKVLEYAAAGCAILGPRQGDIPYLLDDGRAALLLPEAEPQTWARALFHLLDDDEDRIRLGKTARNHILSHFTWKITAGHVERILLAARDRTPVVFEDEPVLV